MTIQWLKIVLASVFEVGWVVGLKYSYNVWTWLATVVLILLTFYLIIMAGRDLPVGTVYAVFVGLGTIGTLIVDIVVFNEPFVWGKVLLIGVILVGVIGLKFVTDEKQEQEKGSEA